MALLHQQTSLSVSQLAHMLGVSEVTIRKDLTLLEQQQMLYRVHGSAILANPYIQERHVNDKEKLCSDQKRAIGAYAARLVEPRDTILIASGTTTLAMAREIREVEELTAITTSLSVATTLAENDECTVIQLGGVLRNSSFSVVGPFAEQMLRQGLYTFVGTDTHSNAYLDALRRAKISKKVFDAVNVLKENNRTLF